MNSNDLIDYTIYVPDTGQVLRTGKVPDEEHAWLQIQPGEALYLGKIDEETECIVFGRVRKLTEAERIRRRQKPSDWHQWDAINRRWIDMREPATIRASEVLALKARITDLEAKQPRIFREIALDEDPEGARERLRELGNQISKLRDRINYLESKEGMS